MKRYTHQYERNQSNGFDWPALHMNFETEIKKKGHNEADPDKDSPIIFPI